MKLCAYPQKILIHFFLGVSPFLNLEIWPKLKILHILKTVRQRNSSEAVQKYFVKLSSYEGHQCVDMHFTGNADLIFLRSNLYPFWTLVKIILCNSDETGFLSDCPSLMLGIAIRYIKHSQAMLERGESELAHSFIIWLSDLTVPFNDNQYYLDSSLTVSITCRVQWLSARLTWTVHWSNLTVQFSDCQTYLNSSVTFRLGQFTITSLHLWTLLNCLFINLWLILVFLIRWYDVLL